MDVFPDTTEPVVSDWMPMSPQGLLRALGVRAGTRAVVAVDGRGANGKTSLAAALAAAHECAEVVHTDDVAWNHSILDWDGELREGVLLPFRKGRAVSYRPPGWGPHGREGAITVPATAELLLVEGVGASRKSLADWLDATIWVQADPAVARERGIARDLELGVNGTDRDAVEAFWDHWLAEEEPFLEADAPWRRATAIVSGTATGGAGDASISASLRRR